MRRLPSDGTYSFHGRKLEVTLDSDIRRVLKADTTSCPLVLHALGETPRSAGRARWYPARRRLAVELVLQGVMTAPQLQKTFRVSRSEFAAWCREYADRRRDG